MVHVDVFNLYDGFLYGTCLCVGYVFSHHEFDMMQEVVDEIDCVYIHHVYRQCHITVELLYLNGD